MSVAIIEAGGKQHLVRVGDTVIVNRLENSPEEQIEFTDMLHGKKVTARILTHDRAQKVHVVKFKSKVRYLRRRGHRQHQTHFKVESIA